MGTKNNPGKFDCYVKAHPDEPLFVLRAKDINAPHLVEAWADMAEYQGEDPVKVREARECAQTMVQWQRGNRKHTHREQCAICQGRGRALPGVSLPVTDLAGNCDNCKGTGWVSW